jgi:hypothetical protein
MDDLFAKLPPATALPVGTFVGRAWSFDLPLVGLVSRVWQGKAFRDPVPRYGPVDETGTVVNRVLGRRLFEGKVTLEDGVVVIRYGWLTDELKPVSEGCWLGRVQLHGRTIWFALTPAS